MAEAGTGEDVAVPQATDAPRIKIRAAREAIPRGCLLLSSSV